ncbi:MAG: DUF2336 domain-containing protein [Geminicoccaceae bacterium]
MSTSNNLAVAQAPAAGGRRRQMMAQAATDKALTVADVRALEGDSSPQARAIIARKFGSQYDELSQGGHKDLSDAILHLLLKDVEGQVRAALAEEVSMSSNLPVPAVKALAHDHISVAAPILQNSPLLTDEDLVDVVRTNAMQYALAVAGRENISEAVSEALVDTGESEVVFRLVGNHKAKLSTKTMQRVVDDYSEHDAIRDRVVRRPDLPYELVEELVGLIGDRLQWELIEKRKMEPDEAARIVGAARDKASIALVAHEQSDRKLEQHMREQYLAGELDHETVLGFLRDGEIDKFEQALSFHAGLERERIRKLVYNSDRRYLAALCVAADFSTPHYVMLRMAVELAESSLANGRSASYAADTMQFVRNQYEQMKLKKDLIDDLLQR